MEPPCTVLCAEVLETLLGMAPGVASGPGAGMALGAVWFDACFGDAPYGLTRGTSKKGFMGAAWDLVPPPEVWAALIPHMRPGAPVAIFGGTRKFHRLMVHMEDGGLIINPTIRVEYGPSAAPAPRAPEPADTCAEYKRPPDTCAAILARISAALGTAPESPATVHAWVFGQGGGWQGCNVSKAIDKSLGATRAVVGTNPNGRENRVGRTNNHSNGAETSGSALTAPGSPLGQRFEGYHTMLAPSWEPLVMAMVPKEGTFAENAIKHGVAGYNIGGSRIPTDKDMARVNNQDVGMFGVAKGGNTAHQRKLAGLPALGRWPANFIQVCACDGPHLPGCPVFEIDTQGGVRKSGGTSTRKGTQPNVYGEGFKGGRSALAKGSFSGASRYFYCAKAPKSERGAKHPCVKPLMLTEYAARLLLPPPRADGAPRTILILYSGTGSEAIGALAAGWERVIAIEYDKAYAAFSRKRVAEWSVTFGREIRLAQGGCFAPSDFRAHGLRKADWVRRRIIDKTGAVIGTLPGAGFSTELAGYYTGLAPAP